MLHYDLKANVRQVKGMGDMQRIFSNRSFRMHAGIYRNGSKLIAKILVLVCTAMIWVMSSMMIEVNLTHPLAIAASSSVIKVQDSLDTDNKDFSGQSLVQLELSGTDLGDADFSDADLRGAVFNGVNLRGANLQRADLSDAIMYVTNLTDADLTDANLNSTMLLMSRLKNTKIEGADFTYSAIDREQLFDLCKRASGTNPITGADTRESLEC